MLNNLIFIDNYAATSKQKHFCDKIPLFLDVINIDNNNETYINKIFLMKNNNKGLRKHFSY